ncbi:MAG: hypothetical protein KA116_02070 [Proteobacteria bacterium]|nr:hypothetical protein [Pseudomonadota bacterium]
MRKLAQSLFISLIVGVSPQAFSNPIDFCNFLLEGIGEATEVKNLERVPAWTVAPKTEFENIRAKVLAKFQEDPDTMESKMSRELGLTSRFSVRGTVKKILSKISTRWQDQFSPPSVITPQERRLVDEKLLAFPTNDFLKHNAKEATNSDSAKNALNLVEVTRSVTSGNLVKESDVTALESLGEQAENLVVRAQNIRRDSSSLARLDGSIAKYLDNHMSEFEDKISKLKAGESFYIVLPSYSSSSGKLTVETHRISNSASIKRLLKRFQEAKKEIDDLDDRVTQYTYDYIALREAADRLHAVPTREMHFNANGELSVEQLGRKDRMEKLRDKLDETFQNNSPIHPNAASIDHAKVLAITSMRSNSVRTLTLKTIGYGSLILAVAAQSGFLNDHLVQPTLIWMETKDALKDDDWIKKCSDESSLEKVQACLKRYAVILNKFLREKLKKDNKLDDTNAVSESDKEFYRHYSRVSRESYLQAKSIVRNAVSQQLVDTYALQEAYNIFKVQENQSQEEAKSKGDTKDSSSSSKSDAKKNPETAALESLRSDTIKNVEDFHKKMDELNKDKEPSANLDLKVKYIEEVLKTLSSVEFSLENFKEKYKTGMDKNRVAKLDEFIQAEAKSASEMMTKLLEAKEKEMKIPPADAVTNKEVKAKESPKTSSN